MSSLWQKTLMYLGLVDEERLDDEAENRASQPARPRSPQNRSAPATPPLTGRRVEPPIQPVRASKVSSSLGEEPAVGSGSVRPLTPVEAQCDIVEVVDFGDAKVLADRIRDRVPVVMDLRGTDPDMVRRIVDFASGLTYALDGSMTKTADGVILVLPPRVGLGREEKRRLAARGLYNTDE